MSKLTKAQVEHIAKLARLELTHEQAEKMTTELGAILSYIEQLNEVETENVEPTAQITGQTTVLRDDVITNGALTDELLACSPLPIIDHQIASPHAHG